MVSSRDVELPCLGEYVDGTGAFCEARGRHKIGGSACNVGITPRQRDWTIAC
jgi:hypothetical protein